MNWKLLGACSALSLLMFADADAMGFGRRADKAAAAGLGHSAASVRTYGVAKAAKKAFLADNESVKHMSTKDFIERTRGENPGVAPTDSEAPIDEKALQVKLEKLAEQKADLKTEIEAKDREIEKIEGELNTLIADKEFISRGSKKEVEVTINPGDVDIANDKFSFGSLFHGLRGDGDPFASCTDETFDLGKAKESWDRLCELRADVEIKSAELQSLKEELKLLKTELAIRDCEAKARKIEGSDVETSGSEHSEGDGEHTDSI